MYVRNQYYNMKGGAEVLYIFLYTRSDDQPHSSSSQLETRHLRKFAILLTPLETPQLTLQVNSIEQRTISSLHVISSCVASTLQRIFATVHVHGIPGFSTCCARSTKSKTPPNCEYNNRVAQPTLLSAIRLAEMTVLTSQETL